MNPGLFLDLGAELARGFGEASLPADRVVHRFFAARRFLGSKDRRKLGDAFYHLLRHRRRIDEAIEAAAIGGAIDVEKARFAIAAAESGAEGGGALLDRLAEGDAETRERLARASGLAAEFAEPREPGEEARGFSFPDFLWERLAAGREAGARIALARALNGPAPTTLRINRLRVGAEEGRERLREAGIGFRAGRWAPEAVVLEKRVGAAQIPREGDGWFEFQDEASQLASIFAAPQRGWSVIDACAGGGGKSLHLAALMNDEGEIFAFDAAMGRLHELERRAVRAGAGSIRILRDETPYQSEIQDQKSIIALPSLAPADLVFIDAPCSGTGALRRNPDQKWRLTAERLGELGAIQAGLLDRWSRAVKPGGALLYATCSVLREENGAQVEAFLGRSRGFRRDTEAAARLEGAIGAGARELVNDDGDLELLPDRHGCDGFFAARLVRAAH